MKKLLALALAAMLLLTGCKAGKQEKTVKTVEVECLVSVQQRYGDSNEVLNVSYDTDGATFSASELIDTYVDVYAFDGSQKSSLFYNDEGIQRYRIDYSYDKDLKTESLQTNLVENDVASRSIFTYDEAGNLQRLESHGNGDVYINHTAYAYDDRGFLESCDFFDMEGTNLWHYDFTCDDSGKVIGFTICYEGMELGRYTCTYDDAGHLVSQTWTTTNQTYFVHFDYFYTYDESGRLTQACKAEPDGTERNKTVYTYDDQGRLVSIVDTVDDSEITFNYGVLNVPEQVAEEAQAFSVQGVIRAFAPEPEYER